MAGGAQQGEAEPQEGANGHHAIHLPSPSVFPLIAASGFPIIGFGFIYDPAVVAVGAAVFLLGIYGWALEPAAE
jgi:cytochrome c oxidase subunit 1